MKQRILANNEYYHIYSRSIAKYVIFNNNSDFLRFLDILNLYRFTDFRHSYSHFKALTPNVRREIISSVRKTSGILVEVIAFCLMPTHIHLVLKQKADHGISEFMSRVLNSYSRYFNVSHGRKGPLWESRFKDALITTHNLLLHVTRYLHLNASTAGLVEKPEDWKYSSYGDYIAPIGHKSEICNFRELIDMSPKTYQKFAEDQIDYQKTLSNIKKLLNDNYSD